MVKIVGVPENATRLNLFSFSLAREAKRWLHSFKGNSLRTWEEFVEKFLKKYFPDSKTTEGKMEISSFHQFPDESLSEVLDCFRGLLRKMPTHGYSEPVQLNIFIDGLRPQSKQLLDASVGGKIKLKTPKEAMELTENMAASDHAILHDRTYAPTKRSLLKLTMQDATLAQNKLLSRKIEALTETLSKLPQQLQAVSPSHSSVMQVGGCHTCGGIHESGQCTIQEDPSREVNYMGIPNRHGFQGYNQGGPSGFNQGSTGFNQGPRGFNQGRNFTQGSSWRNHPGNQYNKEHKSQPAQNLNQGEDIHEKTNKLEETLNQFMHISMSNYRSTKASIKNLEMQVGQLAKQMAERPSSSFGANTEKNPKEECKAILTRSQKRAQGEAEAEKDQSDEGRTDKDEEREEGRGGGREDGLTP
ncbi:uncharacterized protein [Glycine max]|uniref:uncharacterized protein n=1 Tax=Glycine max TaxID=3847 RepID=UPI0003DECADA|nr:uncharacterized protein LOC102667659 [Glycine max]|eukprot:XP_006603390.1 uncharacterized protein LOC102667659 [Glycine max]